MSLFLCVLVFISTISCSFSSIYVENEFNSSSTASSRRLLQKTFYRMPKLNFCEYLFITFSVSTHYLPCEPLTQRCSAT
jgi:hypothetical protein